MHITPNIVTLSLGCRDGGNNDGGEDYQPIDGGSTRSSWSWAQLNKVASVARNWFRPTARTSAVNVES